jgi:activator of HSP90 ATPase
MGTAALHGDDTIHQDLEFAAPPDRVYQALLDEKQFSALTGATAEIDRNIGGAFRLFGGRVIGRNIELVPNQRIVQAWRALIWPSGVYAIVRFELAPNVSGTRVAFDEAGFPSENRDEHDVGWAKFYWNPLRKYLEA